MLLVQYCKISISIKWWKLPVILIMGLVSLALESVCKCICSPGPFFRQCLISRSLAGVRVWGTDREQPSDNSATAVQCFLPPHYIFFFFLLILSWSWSSALWSLLGGIISHSLNLKVKQTVNREDGRIMYNKLSMKQFVRSLKWYF